MNTKINVDKWKAKNCQNYTKKKKKEDGLAIWYKIHYEVLYN